MISVDEVNVGAARWSEEDVVAGGAPHGGVGSWIAGAEVGLHFHDAGFQQFATFAADQDFT